MPSSNCSAARSGCCNATDANATKRSGCAATHFASPSFCACTIRPGARSRTCWCLYDSLGEIAVGRVPPIAVDAERLQVDALLVHRLQTRRSENAVAPTAAARVRQLRAFDDVSHVNDAVTVHVDHFDALASDHHFATRCRRSLDVDAGRGTGERRDEFSAIRHLVLALQANENAAGMTRVFYNPSAAHARF